MRERGGRKEEGRGRGEKGREGVRERGGREREEIRRGRERGGKNG